MTCVDRIKDATSMCTQINVGCLLSQTALKILSQKKKSHFEWECLFAIQSFPKYRPIIGQNVANPNKCTEHLFNVVFITNIH